MHGVCWAPGCSACALELWPHRRVQRCASALVVNVKDKDAKGDGTTDDTAAILAAIDEAGCTGGSVSVPKERSEHATQMPIIRSCSLA
jgi:polygalacturonase